MAASVTREDATMLIRKVTGNLIVRQLQAILKSEGQPTSGLKNPLQKRLTQCKISHYPLHWRLHVPCIFVSAFSSR